jgi:hypothetical protein
MQIGMQRSLYGALRLLRVLCVDPVQHLKEVPIFVWVLPQNKRRERKVHAKGRKDIVYQFEVFFTHGDCCDTREARRRHRASLVSLCHRGSIVSR